MASLFRLNNRSDEPPVADLRTDLRAIWLLRSRALLREMGIWLVLLGYDPQARRFRSASYLVYASLFFFLWGGMVFLLLVDALTNLLTALPAIAPAAVATGLGSLVLLGFTVRELYQVTRRSPIVFSQADAHLLCMTPLDRRLVVLAWFAGTWAAHAAGLWIFFAGLACALFQIGSPPVFTLGLFLSFALAGLRALSLVMPLSMGLLALIWSVGLWRLRGLPAPRNIRWMPAMLIVLLLALMLLPGWSQGLPALGPLTGLAESILGRAPYLNGAAAGLLLAAGGLSLLWFLARNANLARSAQETQGMHSLQAARFVGRTDLVNDLIYRDRLGAGRPPSRLPVRGGWPVLIWRNMLQLHYLSRPQDLLFWISVTGLNLSWIALPGWEMRVFLTILWVVLALQMAEPLIRRYLSRWWLNRALPFPAGALLADLALIPVVILWLAGLASLLVSWGLGWTVPGPAIWIYGVSVPGVMLCGMLDVLRHARSAQLIAGLCPGPELLAALSSLLLIALVSASAWFLLSYLRLPWGAGMVLLAVFSLAVLYGLYRAASFSLKHLR